MKHQALLTETEINITSLESINTTHISKSLGKISIHVQISFAFLRSHDCAVGCELAKTAPLEFFLQRPSLQGKGLEKQVNTSWGNMVCSTQKDVIHFIMELLLLAALNEAAFWCMVAGNYPR